jgi:hypothetical protein
MRPCRWRSFVQCPTLVALALLALGAPLHAQSIRGVVVDPAGNGVAGVVIMLLGSQTNTTGRALSNLRGEFRVASPAAGTCRLRTLRIGFRPATSAPIILGNVARKDDSLPPFNARVFAEWRDRGDVLQTLEARTDSSGRYHICRVPLRTSLLVRAITDSASALPALVQIDSGLFAHADLVVDRNAAHGTLFAGVVYLDSTHTPIADADVSLPELSLSTRSNERGIFRITEVPRGTHAVVVRKVGYGALETQIPFTGASLQREAFLTRTTTLDSVKVLATRPVNRDFEEHRKIGVGKFITRAQVEAREGRRLSELLSTLAGVHITGKAPSAFVAGSRGPRSISTPTCLANVYLDRMLMYGRRGDPPFDVNSIPPEEVEAIEYCASAAVTPLEYSTLNSACGVMVIWTRR